MLFALIALLLVSTFALPVAAEESVPLPDPQPTAIVVPVAPEGWNLKVLGYYDFNGNGTWDEHEGGLDVSGTIRYGIRNPEEWHSTEEMPFTTFIPKEAHVRIENVVSDYKPDELVCQSAEFDMPADADTVAYEIKLGCRPTLWRLFIINLRRYWNPG